MPGWLAEAVARLAADPWLQATLAALATLVLEDPTTIGCGLLVADAKMRFGTALVGLVAGLVVGDVGLYGIGRLAGPRVVRWGWLSAERVERASLWLRRHLVASVILSRFVPGLRFPTYVGAGLLRAPFHRFLLVVVGAALVWTLMLLSVTVALGSAILPWLGRFRWPAAAVAIMLLALAHRHAARRLDRPTLEDGERRFSSFEFWPPWLFYLPVGAYYAWLALRHRSLTLPMAANPSIFSGGFIGESKSAILELVPPSHRRWIAPWVVVEKSAGSSREGTIAAARAALTSASLAYPLVAKPDVGQRGAGVSPIHDEVELEDYLARFPAGHRVMLQKLACAPPARARGGHDAVREAGVLYWRRPGSTRGAIFSITLKHIPVVTGDGRRSVRELILGDLRARRLARVYLRRHAGIAERVLPPGEELPLVFAGNHCQGAIFSDGTRRATPQLLDLLDGIARAMPEFYYGRFDLRFDDLEAFLRGEELQIVEINGAGAEATHIWDASARLGDAYATLFEQFRILFTIGADNRRRGHRPLGAWRFLREAVAYRRTARGYPLTQ